MPSITVPVEHLEVTLRNYSIKSYGFEASTSDNILENQYAKVKADFKESAFTDIPYKKDLQTNITVTTYCPAIDGINEEILMIFSTELALRSNQSINVNADINIAVQKIYDLIDDYSIDNVIKNKAGLLFKMPRYNLCTATIETQLRFQ